MDVNGTVSMAVKAMKKTHKEPSDFLTPLKWVRSILQKQPSVYETRTLLEATIKSNPDTECRYTDKTQRLLGRA